jgi:hypothetical protein
MRAKEFIVETAMMGKIADSGKIIRILKKAHTVPFSDEKNWLLVDTDPGKGNKGLGIKWIPADTRFEWVRPYRDSIDENFADDSAEAYRAHLIKTLPQIMKLFANIGKGWIPSKEQMLSAVDTAYIVMKHTGDAKQAGKVLMDELNTLYRMSKGKQDVAESDLDKYKKYIRPVVKSTPKIEKDNTPSGRTTDHIEWKVTSPTGEIHRYSSKKQAQAKFDSFGPKEVAEGSTEAAMSNAVTFFRGEPILSQERLNQLKSSIGKPYPILRKEGSAANIGTYMSPDGKKATSFVQQALAGQGTGGTVTQIQVDPNSFSKGDGGIDEAVIITNIAGLVSDQKPNENDPLRIQDRKQAMLKYLGPGVQKYLNDPLLTNPNLVQRWYNPEFAQKNWNTINSGKQAVTKPGESEIQERMISVLGSLAEKIRRDPEVISYFIGHNPGNWIEYNFRMNSDGSGTKVVDVKYYPPAMSGVAEEMQHKKITELFDAKTAFPLQWDNQFASSGEVHAEAYDADGRVIDISFTPTGYGRGIEIVFKRGGSYDLTGQGDASRVLATVVNAISQYLQKYQPPYIAFSAKSTGGRAGAYTAMIKRLARGYTLLDPEEYPEEVMGFLDYLGSDKPFILVRS